MRSLLRLARILDFFGDASLFVVYFTAYATLWAVFPKEKFEKIFDAWESGEE